MGDPLDDSPAACESSERREFARLRVNLNDQWAFDVELTLIELEDIRRAVWRAKLSAIGIRNDYRDRKQFEAANQYRLEYERLKSLEERIKAIQELALKRGE